MVKIPFSFAKERYDGYSYKMSDPIICMGTLYIVTTPIGNLEDISIRALKILRSVDLIAAEDTRQSRKLLARFRIHARLISYREHNERAMTETLLRYLSEGKSIALITDGGTPCISDPGMILIAQAQQEKIPVVPIPGPSAVITGVSISGLNAERFIFEGFLPRQRKKRELHWKDLAGEERAIVLYESPHRLLACLEEMVQWVPERQCAVCRELTKNYEEIVRGLPSELLDHFRNQVIRGEITIVMEMVSGSQEVDDAVLDAALEQVLTTSGSTRDTARAIASRLNVPFRRVYRRMIQLKNHPM
jgi:16S rRNA (cytidine1402-2'-O)-methyltransferase